MASDTKKIVQSKTMRVAAVVAVLGVLETNFQLIQPLLGEWSGLTYIVLSMAMVLLRLKTTQALK